MIGWLTSDDNVDIEFKEWADAHPEHYPVRRGRLLASVYTQTFVVEPVSGVTGTLIGMLTFP